MVGIASVTRISCGHPGPGIQINPPLPPAWNCTLSTRECSFLHRTLQKLLSSHISVILFTQGNGNNDLYPAVFQLSHF